MANTSLGYLKGFSLDSILSMVEMDRESWTLKVDSDGRIGFLFFQTGEIIDAKAPGFMGDKAAIEMISWENSVVQIKDASQRKRTIRVPLMTLLLEGSRIKDELKQQRSVEKKKFQEAVDHIIAFRLQKGQEILISILRKNPRFHMGWLWYSRTISTMKDINTALNRAHSLAPENEKIIKEKEKQARAAGLVTEKTVRRCPFCWAPLSPKAQFCIICRLQLFISKEALGQRGESVDANVVDRCVKRYAKVLEKEQNLHAAYYMAIAHYNMDDFDRTLELLNDTVALSGGRPFFKNQLQMFVTWMASGKILEPVAATPSPPIISNGQNKTILVVEDSATTRKVVKVTLNMKGFRVIEAEDGLQAFSRLSEETPDLILLDIILPKMNGYEILATIKNNRQFKHIPVIMLTGRDGFINKMKGKMAGATAYLTKPFQPENLLLSIEKHI